MFLQWQHVYIVNGYYFHYLRIHPFATRAELIEKEITKVLTEYV